MTKNFVISTFLSCHFDRERSVAGEISDGMAEKISRSSRSSK
jgi:hypothetical protein